MEEEEEAEAAAAETPCCLGLRAKLKRGAFSGWASESSDLDQAGAPRPLDGGLILYCDSRWLGLVSDKEGVAEPVKELGMLFRRSLAGRRALLMDLPPSAPPPTPREIFLIVTPPDLPEGSAGSGSRLNDLTTDDTDTDDLAGPCARGDTGLLSDALRSNIRAAEDTNLRFWACSSAVGTPASAKSRSLEDTRVGEGRSLGDSSECAEEADLSELTEDVRRGLGATGGGTLALEAAAAGGGGAVCVMVTAWAWTTSATTSSGFPST